MRLSAVLPYTDVRLPEVMERQWVDPDARSVQRSIRANSPSTRGR
jgi:hypothetical protein